MTRASYRLDVNYLHTEFERQGVTATDIQALDGLCPVCAVHMKPLIEVQGSTAGASIFKDYCPDCSYVQFRTLPGREWIASYYASRWDADRASPKALADDTGAYANSVALLQTHAVDSDSSIFDLGAGYGVFLKRCEAEGYTNLSGIEASPRRARHCIAIGLDVVEATGETMADHPVVAARAPFDIVHSSHVIEHVYDLSATMREIRRLLKPGGLAIVVVPNILSENLLVVSQGIFHIRNFTPASLTHLFAASGFDVVALNSGDSIEIVARMRAVPDVPPNADATAADRLLEGFAKRLSEEFGVAAPADGRAIDASIFLSRPPRRRMVRYNAPFPLMSKPGLLRLLFGANFTEAPVFGPRGRAVRAFDLRNLAFKLRRRLFGVGRLELSGSLHVDSATTPIDAGLATLTIRFPGPSVPILLK